MSWASIVHLIVVALPEGELERQRVAVLATAEVEGVNHLAAIYAGASEVVLDADLDLAEGLETTQIEAVLDDVEARVREIHPEIERVRVLLNSPGPRLAHEERDLKRPERRP